MMEKQTDREQIPPPVLNERGLEQQFVDATLETLFDETKESTGEWMYMWKDEQERKGYDGVDYYAKAVLTPEYLENSTNLEKIIYEKYYEQLKKYFEPSDIKNIIELGPGGVGKLFDLLKRYDIAGKGYVAVDRAPGFLDVSERIGNDLGLHSLAIKSDFLNKKIYADTPGTLVNVGCTIGNQSKSKNSDLVETWCAGGKRHALVSYFNKPADPEAYEAHKQKTLSMYNTPQMEEWILASFGALELDMSKLEYVAEYVEGSGGTPDMIKMGVRVKQGQTLTHKVGGKTLTKHEGETMWAITSRRYAKDQFDEMIQAGGAKVNETYTEGGVSVAVVETPRKGIMQTIREVDRRVRNGVMGVLVGGLLVGGTLKINDMYQIQKERAQVAGYVSDVLAMKSVRKIIKDMPSLYPRLMSSEEKIEYLEKIYDDILPFATEMYPVLGYINGGKLRNHCMITLANNPENFSRITNLRINKHMNREKSLEKNIKTFIFDVWIPEMRKSALVLPSEIERPYQYLDEYRDAMKWNYSVISEGFKSKEKMRKLVVRGVGSRTRIHTLKYLKNGNSIVQLKMWDNEGLPIGNRRLGDSVICVGNEEHGYSTNNSKEMIDTYRTYGYAEKLARYLRAKMNGEIDFNRCILNEKDRKLLVGRIIELHKEGYNFSYLVREYNQESLDNFIQLFVDEGELGGKEILQENINAFMNIIEKKFFRGDRGSAERKEIRSICTRIIIEGYVANKDLSYSRSNKDYTEFNIASWIKDLRYLFEDIEGFQFSSENKK